MNLPREVFDHKTQLLSGDPAVSARGRKTEEPERCVPLPTKNLKYASRRAVAAE